MRKQTQEARVFRRVQAVREVVAGHHLNAVPVTFHCTHAVRRTWGQCFAQEGPQGSGDYPRPGRPRPVTCALAQPLHHRVDPDPLERDAGSSQGSCHALAAV